MTIQQLVDLLNTYNNNENYYILDYGKKRKHIEIFFIGKKQKRYSLNIFTVLVIDDCVECIFDYTKSLFIAEGFKDKDNLRVKCGKNRVCTRYINLFIKNIIQNYNWYKVKLITIPFIDYCYNKEPNRLIEMI